MKEEDKRTFDSLAVLADQSWREWDHKTKHEWRLSFGMWAALLAATAAIAKAEVILPLWPVVLGASIVLLVHVFFLNFIRTRLDDHRKELANAIRPMLSLAGIKSSSTSPQRAWYFHPSIWTQAIITLLLLLGLILVTREHNRKAHSAPALVAPQHLSEKD